MIVLALLAMAAWFLVPGRLAMGLALTGLLAHSVQAAVRVLTIFRHMPVQAPEGADCGEPLPGWR